MDTVNFGQLRNLQFPPESHIISNGIMKRHSKLIVAASPKSYKSFLMNTMLVQLLTGGHLFGAYRNHSRIREDLFHIEPVDRVLLIEQELGLEDNRDRLVPFYQSLSHLEQQCVESGLFLHSCDYDLRLDETKGRERLGNVIAKVKPQVVVFDPLIKFHHADENDPSEMNSVMLNLSRMQQNLDFTSGIIHHNNKSADKDGLDLLRGGSSIAGDLDTCLQVTVWNRSAAMVKIDTILKRGKPIEPYILKLNEDTLRMEFYGWQKTLKKDLAKGATAGESVN